MSCLFLQGPAGLKGEEGRPGIAGLIVSMTLLYCSPSEPSLSVQPL